MATKSGKHTEALAPEIMAALAIGVSPVEPERDSASRMRSKLFQRIHGSAADFKFVHSHEGEWVNLMRGIEIKILRQDAHSRTMLIRMAPHSSLPAHVHELDEESLVMDGAATVQGVACQVGDYHFAPAGKDHDPIESVTGCLLFVRGSVAQSARQ